MKTSGSAHAAQPEARPKSAAPTPFLWSSGGSSSSDGISGA